MIPVILQRSMFSDIRIFFINDVVASKCTQATTQLMLVYTHAATACLCSCRDLVLSVDGRRVDGMPLEGIYSMIRGPPGTKVLLCMSEGAKSRRYVSLTRQGAGSRSKTEEQDSGSRSHSKLASGPDEQSGEGLSVSASNTGSSMGSVNQDADRQRRQNQPAKFVPTLNLSSISSQSSLGPGQDPMDAPSNNMHMHMLPPENPKKSQDMGREEDGAQLSMSQRKMMNDQLLPRNAAPIFPGRAQNERRSSAPDTSDDGDSASSPTSSQRQPPPPPLGLRNTLPTAEDLADNSTASPYVRYMCFVICVCRLMFS
jgi:hypothetical protein